MAEKFWGPEGMCTSFYLGALRAAVIMGHVLVEDVSRDQKLLDLGFEAGIIPSKITVEVIR